MFIKRCKGLITHEEWVDARSNRIYSRGDKTKRAVKVKVPIYLPQKLSKKTGKTNGIPYRQLFLGHLTTGEAYQVEIMGKDSKYYCHITFDVPKQQLKYTSHTGIVGVDTNPNGFALTIIDNQGNYKEHCYLKQHELLYARTDRRKNLCGELVKRVADIAKEKGLGIVIEELRFKDDQDVRRSYGYKEKVPTILKDIFIKGKDEFIKQNEWKRWSIISNNINKNIEGKEVNIPGFWIENRKEILGSKLPCNF